MAGVVLTDTFREAAVSSAANWVRIPGGIKLESSIAVTDDEETLRKRADVYLASLGYRQTGSEPYLQWRRSSSLRSMVTFSPKKLAAKMTLQPDLQEGGRTVRMVLQLFALGSLVG